MTQKIDNFREKGEGRRCPECGKKMVGAKAEYYRCTSCGYDEASFTVDWGSVALGLTVGVGIVGGVLYLRSQ